MKWNNFETAMKEAERFLDKAKRCKKCEFGIESVYPGRDAAAMKRASLDLSKALSALRTESEYKR